MKSDGVTMECWTRRSLFLTWDEQNHRQNYLKYTKIGRIFWKYLHDVFNKIWDTPTVVSIFFMILLIPRNKSGAPSQFVLQMQDPLPPLLFQRRRRLLCLSHVVFDFIIIIVVRDDVGAVGDLRNLWEVGPGGGNPRDPREGASSGLVVAHGVLVGRFDGDY